MDLRYIENPCIIQLAEKVAPELREVKDRLDCEGYYRDENVLVADQSMYENYQSFQKGYKAAVDLLTKKRMKQLVPFLVYNLVPQFKPIKKGDYCSSKIGGIPDLRYALGMRKDLVEGLKKIWPICGCCHQRMKFLGGFDLFAWSLPIYANTMLQFNEYQASSAIGSKRFVEHRSIHANQIYNVFACEDAGYHWDNPNLDCHILISQEPYAGLGNDLIDSEKWIEAYHKAGFSEKDVVTNTPQQDMRITGYKLRFDVDFESFNSQSKEIDYEIGDKYEDLTEKHPKILGNDFTDDFRLFGEARSQQTPKRYMATNSYPHPRRMTPFLNYNDEGKDMTYQLYFDLFCSDGYCAYGKCDASCT